ncbi:NAD-dependent epimerase/dehydratase family protein [Candidatus Woesearchaeota archaeon]|nr:NAD-dependent epimerase/dehydratase family protein [Candidatus Woesearchaeota archaeon]
MEYSNILITGSAGFIGFHLAKTILENYKEVRVIGVDNLNNYYNPRLKEKRNNILKSYANYTFLYLDFSNWNALLKKLRNKDLDLIVHLGAQAGVRHSIKNPWVYIQNNDLGTLNIFELARHLNIDKVVYASSSSVYGGSRKIPFKEHHKVDKPISLYAATKRHNELIANVYHHLYGINAVGLRFFTVYGEFGRPDMAIWKFTKNILTRKPIDVYNYGRMARDFTYVSDVITGVLSAIEKNFKYEIFNLGNGNPIELEEVIRLIEAYTGKKAIKNYLPLQPGDIEKTWADLTKSKKLLSYAPKVSIEEGLKRFVTWFKENKAWLLKL